MNILLVAILFFLVPALVIGKSYRILVFLTLLSLICNLFYFNFFGTRIPLHAYIALCVTPFILPYLKKLLFSRRRTFLQYLSADFFSLILIGGVFTFVFPWELLNEAAWNQGPLGRSIVALFRLFLDIMMAVFIHFCICTLKVSTSDILKMALGIAFVQIGVGLVDFYANYPIRSLLFVERQIPGRYLGMSHEPRSMARNTAFVLILTFSAFLADKVKFKVGLKHILILLFGVLFTVSVSSMIAVGISAFLFFVLKNKEKRFTYLVSFILVGLISFQVIKTTNFYKNHILPRITMVAIGGLKYGVIKGEPLWITRFEVMDRAAVNFFYRYPKNLWFGAGPNLVGIPSSPYLTQSAKNTFGKVIVAVPGTGLIYTLGRNGILGLMLLALLYLFLLKKTEHDKFRSTILFFSFFFFLFVHPAWFFFNIGLVSSVDN